MVLSPQLRDTLSVYELSLEQQARVVGENVIALPGAGGTQYLIVRHSRFSDDRSDFFRLQCVQHAYVSADGSQQFLYEKKGFTTLSNTIELTVDRKERVAKFGPTGSILVDRELRSRGLASYLMAKVILWGIQNYPDFRVDRGRLCPLDETATGPKHASFFYRKRGFDIEWDDDSKDTGHFSKDRIDQLNAEWNKLKVQELSADNLLREHVAILEKNTKLQASNAMLERLWQGEERRLRRHLWTWRLLLAVCVFLILVPHWTRF